MATTNNPLEVTTAIAGVDHPACEDAVLARAKDDGASGEVLEGLQAIPDRAHEGPSGATHEFSS